jgi:hypothetical protein
MRQIASCRPDLILPLQMQTVAELLKELPDDGSEMTLVSNEWA